MNAKDANAGKSATLTLGSNQQSHLPVRSGSIGPDVIDVGRLYRDTGCFTYDPGFTSTANCSSKITYIDGDKGVLLYRGYPIEQLAEKSNFVEVCHLLLNGELPTKAGWGSGLKLIGTAERVEGGISVRVHPAFLYGGHPLASVNGPFNAVTFESDAITEITMSGPGAGGPQTASAVLGGRDLGHDPAGVDAGDDRGPDDRHRRPVGVLPAHGGGRPSRRPGPDRRAAGDAGRLDQIGGPARAGRQRPPGDGPAPAAGVQLLRRRADDQPARLHARAAAGDPRARRGVQLSAGLIERYRADLPFAPEDPVVTLGEGSTPLVLAEKLSERAGAEVWLKIEGANPTGSRTAG